MKDSDNQDWKTLLAIAVIILSCGASCSTCRYVQHRIEMERIEK